MTTSLRHVHAAAAAADDDVNDDRTALSSTSQPHENRYYVTSGVTIGFQHPGGRSSEVRLYRFIFWERAHEARK